MPETDFKKLRTGLEFIQRGNDRFGRNELTDHIADLLDLLPKPISEVPDGPWTWSRDRQTSLCYVLDVHGEVVALKILNAATAKLLASAWEARRLLVTCRCGLQRHRDAYGISEIIGRVDAHLADHGGAA